MSLYTTQTSKFKGFSAKKVLKQVQNERNMGFSFVKEKRDKIRQDLKLLNDNSKKEEIIRSNMIARVKKGMISTYYKDRLMTEFTAREFWDEPMAQNLTQVAKFDYDEMFLDELDYFTQDDRLTYGVAIRIQTGWDSLTGTPIFALIDPLTWIPDPLAPLSTFTTEKGFLRSYRFHGFENLRHVSELTEENGYFDIKEVTKGIQSESRTTHQAKTQHRSFQDIMYNDDNIVEVYDHYTIIEGKKVLVTLANDYTKIVRLEVLAPILKEEKKNDANIEFPIVLNYYKPRKWDPFGDNIFDDLSDKQRAIQIFMNLGIHKAKLEAMGGDFLYDREMVMNVNDFLNPTMNSKFIPINTLGGTKPIGAAVQEVERSQVRPSTFDIKQLLEREGELDTAFSAAQLGVRGDRSITLGEAQQIQENANLGFALHNKINNWGEKMFWKLWYRSYVKYFKRADEKLVRVTGGSMSRTLTLKREDFITKTDPDIKIMSKAEKDEMDRVQLANYSAYYALIKDDPNKHPATKRYAERKFLRLQGLDEEEIAVHVPYSATEMDALMQLELLNRNEPVKIQDLQEDHFTYVLYYKQAQDTPAKYAAIEGRKMAMRMSGQEEALNTTQATGGTSSNIGAGQIANAAVQETRGGRQIASRADVI